jgi:hypothetical protein
MFYDPDKLPAFSFEESAASTSDQELRHLVNRLRLEFRTASQRQLVDAVESAFKSTTTYSGEKTIQLARLHLDHLLKSRLEFAADEPTEPPFRV